MMLAVALASAGCSGAKKGPSPAPEESLEVRARRAVLQRGDLPTGWTANAAGGTDAGHGHGHGHGQAWAEFRNCVPGGQGLDAGAVQATSGVFASGGATVESTVAYVGADQTSQFAGSVTSTSTLDCGKSALSAEAVRRAPPGVTPRREELVPLTVTHPAGSWAWGIRNTTTYSSGSKVVTDLMLVIKGDALGRLVFVNDGGPFPSALEQALIEKVAGRA